MSVMVPHQSLIYPVRDGISAYRPSGGGGGWSAGNTLLFDGINDYVVLGSKITLTGDFTISVWFFPVSHARTLISDDDSTNEYFFLTSATRFEIRLLGGAQLFDFAAGTMSLDNWHHLMFTRSGNSGSAYVDGGSAVTKLLGSSVTITLDLIATFNDQSLFWDGRIDDFYVWDGVVGTAQNAIDLYNGGTPVDPESVIPAATYKYLFNESTGTDLPDTGSSANNGTLINFADPDANWVSRL